MFPSIAYQFLVLTQQYPKSQLSTLDRVSVGADSYGGKELEHMLKIGKEYNCPEGIAPSTCSFQLRNRPAVLSKYNNKWYEQEDKKSGFENKDVILVFIFTLTSCSESTFPSSFIGISNVFLLEESRGHRFRRAISQTFALCFHCFLFIYAGSTRILNKSLKQDYK